MKFIKIYFKNKINIMLNMYNFLKNILNIMKNKMASKFGRD